MNSSERVNIIRLAKELNLSKSTVSRAFRGASDINPRTRDRILAKAKELRFLPNRHASNLRQQKSNTIALVVPEISDYFLARAASGIEKVANEENYHVLICFTNDDAEKEVSIIEELNNGIVDGVIMSASASDGNSTLAHLQSWELDKLPLVFLNQAHGKIKTASVTSNEYLSSFEATEHLIKNGCKKIAYLVINRKTSCKNQIKGYIDALEANGISFEEELIIECGNEPSTTREILSNVFQTMKPDGVFASAEKLTIVSHSVCHELGIPIPGEVRIIGFCDMEISSLLRPSLSTIVKPAFDMGVEAARLLFRMLENKGIEKRVLNEHIVFRSALIKRESSAALQ